MWYASSCSGTTISTGVSSAVRRPAPRSGSRCAGSSNALDAAVSLGRQRDDRPAAGLGLLDVADHLLEHVIVRRDRDDRHLLVDERDRPVLHLAGRIALGVDVRDLLQLQRAFERDRIVDAAAEVQEVARAGRTAARSLRSCGSTLQRLLEQQRQLQQRVDVRLRRFGDSVPRIWPRYSASRCSATSCDVNALVEATPISGPGVRVDRAVGLARRHAADHVADRELRAPFFLRLAQRRQRVRRLARLRDGDGQRVRRDDRSR